MAQENKEEFVKNTIKVGNSAGVLLPKRLLGSKVKITVLSRQINIRKKTMALLEKYLKDIEGVYIMNKDPIEVLAISNSTKKIIKDKIKISIVPLKKVREDLDNPKLRLKITSAEPILNNTLLTILKKEIKEEI